MSDLAKSLLDMQKEAENLVVKSESFQGAQAQVTASISKADSDAATANGSLSDAKEKSNKSVDENEGSFPKESLNKSECGIKAAEVAENASKDKEEDKKEEKEDVKKSEEVVPAESLEKSIQESEVGKNAFEVSPFLAEMTEKLSKSLEGVQVALHGSNGATEETLDAFAKSFGVMFKAQQAVIEQNTQLTGLVKSMSEKMNEMSSRMEEIEGQPTMRKSVRDINVHNKDFNKSIGETSQVELSKSEKLSIAMDLFQKGDTVQELDVLNIESGSKIRPEVESRIAQVASSR